MPSLYSEIRSLSRLIQKALMPTYTINIEIRPDDPNACTGLEMIDDDGNVRFLAGKRGNDYGAWISRRGFPLTENLNTKYLSWTGSLLTPKIKYAGITNMVYDGEYQNAIGSYKYWKRDEYTTPGSLVFSKDYIDENLNLVGFYKLNKADGTYDRVQVNNPYLCSSFIEVLQDEGHMDLKIALTLKTSAIYASVDLEFFVFSDK